MDVSGRLQVSLSNRPQTCAASAPLNTRHELVQANQQVPRSLVTGQRILEQRKGGHSCSCWALSCDRQRCSPYHPSLDYEFGFSCVVPPSIRRHELSSIAATGCFHLPRNADRLIIRRSRICGGSYPLYSKIADVSRLPAYLYFCLESTALTNLERTTRESPTFRYGPQSPGAKAVPHGNGI